MKSIKKGQKYIVVCTQTISRSVTGLGSNGTFHKGCFVTHKGTPTDDPNHLRKPAQVYVWGQEDFPFDHDVFPAGHLIGKRLYDFFKPVPVEVKINIL